MIPVGTLCVIVPPAVRGVGDFVTVVGVLRNVYVIDSDGTGRIAPFVYAVEGGATPLTPAQIAAGGTDGDVADPEILRIIRPPRSTTPVTTTRDEPVTA